MNQTRTLARRNEQAEIDASEQRAIAAREVQSKPRSALEAMAARLQVSTAGLQDTLMATVFKDCSREEFMALVMVSNTYGLNPLLKEIYAFPKRGGGIVPMVGIDGWIKLANEHPQFDGIEFEHIDDDKGVIQAMEGILYRKDRNRPVKMLIETDEFKVDTNPNWKTRRRHMTWVRCYCQTVRVGLGLTGLGVEGDEDTIDMGEIRARSVPSKSSLAEELGDEIPNFAPLTERDIGKYDGDLGRKVTRLDVEAQDDTPARDERGMSEVSEETARQLDAGESEPEPEEEAGEADETDPKDEAIKRFTGSIKAAKAIKAVEQIERDWTNNHRIAFDDGDERVAALEKLIFDKKKALREAAQ